MRLIPGAGVAALFITLAGCSVEDVKRFGYNESQQYACMQRNEDRPNESMNDFKCMSPTERKGMSYDEYQQAREEESR